ncbi:DUF5074 domain-containing protein [Pedobacter sp. FW305-3-2-15-E-R2A2]|jgi:DNA-binding beta-propeller fold protein YncE|uniref:YncE family protein n=1 Tax=Pedobacter sp. FW305-3-2-15-E-R2A2 TaxID=3140251 RepID=UPI00313FEC8B
MKKIRYKSQNVFTVLLLAVMLMSACRKDLQVPKEEKEYLFSPRPNDPIKGIYLVNEGNMGMNKASLDFVDFEAGQYRRNIYSEANPLQVKGLGDVGNDAGVYGSKLYIVVNISNKVEVLDVKTGKRIQQINITNCRYITFNKGKAYVSAYLGQVGNPAEPNGIVAEIDTTTLSEVRRVKVGRQPEEMAIVKDKLYIANSGGYSPGNYERTVSVVDLNSFTETKRIDVAINLHRLKADRFGDLYVTSRGDYLDTHSKLFVIDTQTDQVKLQYDIAVSNLTISNDVVYFYGSEWSHNTGKMTVSYGMLDVLSKKVLDTKFITDGTDKNIVIPYGIAVNPFTKEVFVTDAGNYVSPGVLYCFSPAGVKQWKVTTGDIPAHFAFVYR